MSSQREVYAATAFAANDPQIRNTQAKREWKEIVFSQSSNPPPFLYEWTASGSQDSSVNALGVDAEGSSYSSGGTLPLCGCPAGAAYSNLDVTFDVDAPTSWQLAGSIETRVTGSAPYARMRVRLTPAGGGTPIASFELAPASSTPSVLTLPVTSSGLLAPGSYRFEIVSEASYSSPSGGVTQASYGVALTFPGQPVPALPLAAPALLALALLASGALAVSPRRRALIAEESEWKSTRASCS